MAETSPQNLQGILCAHIMIRVNADRLLDYAHTTANTLQDIADVGGIPFPQTVGSVTVTVLSSIQAAKRNRPLLLGMVDRIHDIHGSGENDAERRALTRTDAALTWQSLSPTKPHENTLLHIHSNPMTHEFELDGPTPRQLRAAAASIRAGAASTPRQCAQGAGKSSTIGNKVRQMFDQYLANLRTMSGAQAEHDRKSTCNYQAKNIDRTCGE
ncbi:hypothetical protein DFH09DRAFT_1082491 [Mycena vulgaris]|nr:hypothetical protein DFH09DRAFT_1108754 [Mycena vulgaris]KAJ6562987.1 hypothetical protein DFH09DRAFT_1082491 [Mycena vulgaris]